MRSLLVIVSLSIPGIIQAADPPAAPDTRAAIQRGLSFLTEDSLTWKENRKCASCHHAPLTLWVVNESKRAGYDVNEKALKEIATWAVAKGDPAKLLTKQPDGSPKQARQSLFRMAIGLGSGDTKDPAVKNWLAQAGTLLAAEQFEDGAWKVTEGREPLVASKEVTTATVLLAMTSPAVAESKEAAAACEKGLKWFLAQPAGDDPQAIALRIILSRRLGKPAGELEPLVKSIRARQNADGGWSQTKTMASDAYASGQALYALAEADVKLDDAAIRKGQLFLANKQRQDGSWPMDSRPMKAGGAGSKNTEPITHAGSTWAVLGLVRTTPVLKADPKR